MQAHERKALSQARLEHAIECLSAARNLLETENYKSAANRSNLNMTVSWRIQVLKRTPILLNRCPFLLCRGAVFELGQMVQLWLSVCRSTMWVYWPFRA